MVESPQHEFDSQQNATITQLWRSMRWVAVPFVVLGVVYGAGFVLAVIQAFKRPETILATVFVGLAMCFFLALGVWTRKAAAGFQRITETTGQDISHLMDALDSLRKKYSLLSLIIKIYIAMLVIGLGLSIVMMLTSAKT